MAEYAVMPDKTLEKLECVRISDAKNHTVDGKTLVYSRVSSLLII